MSPRLPARRASALVCRRVPTAGLLTVLVLLCLPRLLLAAPNGWSVTLPDAGSYSYWVQSKAGPISALPTEADGKKTLTIAKPVAAGDTLYVLDAHTGEVAVQAVSLGADGHPAPATLTVADFKPIQPTLATPAPSHRPEAGGAGGEEARPAPESALSGIGRLFTFIFGLAIGAAVLWAIWQLYKTRGAPLLALARRAGVQVPDPTPLDPEADVAPVYSPPVPRPLAKVPDEATAPAPVRAPRLPAGTGVSATGVPQLVGLQGLAAGSSFSLTREEATIGRDGDNDIVLAENTVSRRHARCTRDSAGRIVINDEGSANGIYINGTRVERAVLSPGDEVKIGDNYFRFEA